MLSGSKNYFVFVVGAVFPFEFKMNIAMQLDVLMAHTRHIESNWERSSSLIIVSLSIIRHNSLGERVIMERMFRLVDTKVV